MQDKNVWDVYEVVGIKPGYYAFPGNFGEFDLRKISMKRAEQLVAQKFPYLKKKAAPAVIKAPANELKTK